MEEFVQQVSKFLVPYLAAQLLSIIILAASWKNTRIARGLFALLFFWASVTNASTALLHPGAYLSYADLSAPLYRQFINGWFSEHIRQLVLPVAAAQFLVATGMLLKGWWVKWSCTGAILFLLAIAPLLVGAGFPFSITVSIGAGLILKNDDRNYIWRRQFTRVHTDHSIF